MNKVSLCLKLGRQITALFICFLSLSISLAGKEKCNTDSGQVRTIPVAYVPASFPVNFALCTSKNNQYTAFYDTSHQMIIACRKLTDSTWDYQKLDSKVNWDSHNYLSMVVDNNGYIHLTGNMHSSKLIYFRSTIPYNIHSMLALHTMTGNEEDVTTYPEFMGGQNGELLFHYRYGRSGSGFEVFNLWNAIHHTWERLLGTPLTDGHGKMNAYMQGPLLGSDGYFHLLWVWRNTPDCATNHTLSYARSKDLLQWESIRGEKVELPLTIDYRQLYIDTTQVHGGLINIGIKIGFDADRKVLIGYHKYDSLGSTQLFLARFKNSEWISKQITKWKYRWDFKGYGTIVNELLIEPPKASSKKGHIIFGYHHIQYGNGQYVVDEKTLEPIEAQPLTTPYPAKLDSINSHCPGMVVNKIIDSCKDPKGDRYLLRWETLAPNRDQEQNIKPPNTLLELVEY